MASVITWGVFLEELKTEIGIQTADVREDALLLALANESLTQIVSTAKDLREFRIDETLALTAIDTITFTGLYIAEIDQAYYHRVDLGVLVLRYDLVEQSGSVGPAPFIGGTNSYTVKQVDNGGNFDAVFKFYPIDSARIDDRIQIVGSGFQTIADPAARMPYPSCYPQLKLMIAERYAIKRNIDPTKIQILSKLVDRSAPITATGTRDNANTENASLK